MKVCACICELNPFHNGHEYFFRMMRERTGADYIIAVMSGDFVQRGTPSICDKYARCAQALMGGADLVVELPVMYATASADYFAMGAISAIINMGCVDTICFGSECGDINMLLSLAGVFEENDPGLHILSQGSSSADSRNYKITKMLKEGVSYAKAYASVTGNDVAPNDMLAVRYIRSLSMLGSDMEKVCIKREGGDYNDRSDGAFSASAVRHKILGGGSFAHMVPKYVYRNLESIARKSCPVTSSDLSVQLYTVLSGIIGAEEEEGEDLLTRYMDVSANIAGRIRASMERYTDYESFVGIVHSKEYTKSRVYRALLHILLDIRKDDYPPDIEDCLVSYIRILGFRRSSQALLGALKENCIVPVISKAGDAAAILDDEAMYLFKKDVKAANLYDMACTFKFGKEPVHDYRRELVII